MEENLTGQNASLNAFGKADGSIESNSAIETDESIGVTATISTTATTLDALVSTEYRAKYDAAAKELLVEKVFLALIMKFCVEEYKDCELEEIESLIEGTPEISVAPVQRDMPPRIIGSDTVDKTQDEGTYYFDIKFDAALPKKLVDEIEEKTKHGKNKSVRHALGVIINVEPHGKSNPGYPILTRSEYYQARLLSSQYGTVFTGEEYEKLKHVYSIWILLNSPAYSANTVSVYDKTEKHIIGVGEDEAIKELHSDPSTYQLMTGVVIRLGDVDKTENELLKVLGTILSNRKNVDEKVRVLKKYEIPMTQEVERKVGDMYSLADVIAEEAAEEQKKEDMLTAIRNLMDTMKWTVEKAMDALKIPQEQRSVYAGRVQNG